MIALAVAVIVNVLAPEPAAAAKRLALVVGNGAYREAPLRNPPGDARAMAAALRELGFEVIALENANRRKMQRAVLEFGRKLKEAEVGLFYYAGHGMQVRGANYLIPIGAEITHEDEVEVEAVDTNYVVARMGAADNKFNIVILDACRNNPFERSFRSAQQGLAAITAPTGTLIAYATAPGSVAADGDGANGLYTSALVEAMRRPGLKIEETFKQVRGTVVAKSKGQQTPWESSSLVGDFLFKAAPAVAIPAPAPAPVPVPAAPQTNERDVELAFWNSVKDSRNPDDFDAYLKTYPHGSFVRLAEVRLRALKAPPPAIAGPAVMAPTPAPVVAAPVVAAPAPTSVPVPAPAEPPVQTALVTPPPAAVMSAEQQDAYVKQHWSAIRRVLLDHAEHKKRDWSNWGIAPDMIEAKSIELQEVIAVAPASIGLVVTFQFAPRSSSMMVPPAYITRVYVLENQPPEFKVLEQQRYRGVERR